VDPPLALDGRNDHASCIKKFFNGVFRSVALLVITERVSDPFHVSRDN